MTTGCPQLHLELDSLEWIHLSLEIQEKWGVTLTEDACTRIFTLRDLLQEITSESDPDRPLIHTEFLAKPEETLGADEKNRLKPAGPMLLPLGFAFYILNWIAIHAFLRLRVEGRSNLPSDGPFIIAVNHTSDLDHLVMGASLNWSTIRRIRWGGEAHRLFCSPFRRLISRTCGVYPVGEWVARSALASGCLVLQWGHVQIWFPEGWRSPDGRIQPFARGIGFLLKHTGVPVVPTHLSGVFEALPRWRNLPRPGPCKVTFGIPLDPRKLEARGKGNDSYTRIARALHDAMAEQATAAERWQSGE